MRSAKLSITFETAEFNHEQELEYLHTFRLFHNGGGGRKPNELTAFNCIPTQSEDIVEATMWQYLMICMITYGVDSYEWNFENKDWAKVYREYVLKMGAQCG